MNTNFKSLCAVATLAALPFASFSDEFAQKARAVFTKNKDAVVTVQLVVKSKLSMQGSPSRSSESRQEVTGAVVDPSGLAVVSLSSIDPGQMMQNLTSGDRIKMESELADLKILLPNGDEVPCEVLLRDNDLDLAFIKPKTKPQTPMSALDLAQAGAAEIGDPIVAINRLGNAAGRAHSIAAERISAIVQRPRLFYVPDANMTTSSLGCPCFTLDGKLLGVMVLRATKGASSAGSFSTQNPNYTGIILPTADVQKIARQVPAGGKESGEAPK